MADDEHIFIVKNQVAPISFVVNKPDDWAPSMGKVLIKNLSDDTVFQVLTAAVGGDGLSVVQYTDDIVPNAEGRFTLIPGNYRITAEQTFPRAPYRDIRVVADVEIVLVVTDDKLSVEGDGDLTPPAEVTNLRATAGAGKVDLAWTNPTDEDFDRLELSYSAGAGLITRLDSQDKSMAGLSVEGLNYGTVYAFTVRTVDTAGNKSLGSLVLATLATVVDDFNLAQYITAPVQDVLPDTRPITGTQYTGTVTWFVDGVTGMSGNLGRFTIEKAYTAKAALTPNPGYTFAGLANDSFIYGGAAVLTNPVSGGITITFPTLGKAWYVANYGIDTGGNGLSPDTPVKTVDYALGLIETAWASPHTWTNADIVVIGTSGDTKTILIDNSGSTYPPITLRGMSPTQTGTLTADKEGWVNPSTTNSCRVVEVTGGATVTLGNDLTISGGGQRGDVVYGAGVYVHNNGTDKPFTMNGGTITGNKAYTVSVSGTGAGVHVREDSAFIMNGGVISYNYAFRTGGVAIYYRSTFTMNGGTITNNESEQGGAGVRVLYDGAFTLNGGTISSNRVNVGLGGGVYFGGTGASHFIMNGGTISRNTSLGSGGVYMDSDNTFVMNGGSISDNTGGDYGGGVTLAFTSSFTMLGGTISGNTATAGGGGVAVLGGTFTKGVPNSGLASGIIYGNNGGANGNRAIAGDTLLLNLGHAVYVAPEAGGLKPRELTVLPDQFLDSTEDGEDGGWVE
jgi:hypothetical protein